MAVVAALSVEMRPLEIRTDSKYVMRGVRKMNRRQRSWLEVPNGDLWHECDQLLDSRPTHEVVFTKVKGHSKWRDVRRGTVQMEDKIGNDMADALATTGAAIHELDA
eukprot:8050453-Karenia_brevis.AAC.1